MFAWVALVVAIATEVVATLSLKVAGEGKAWAIGLVVGGYALSFAALYLCLRSLEVGTVYAIWAGAGTAAVAAFGIVVWGESANALKLASLGLVMLGVIGLNLSGAH